MLSHEQTPAIAVVSTEQERRQAYELKYMSCCRLDVSRGAELWLVLTRPIGRTPVLWYISQISNAKRVGCWVDTEIVEDVLIAQVWPSRSELTLWFGM